MIKWIPLVVVYAVISAYGLVRLKTATALWSSDTIIGGVCYGSGFLIWLLILRVLPLSVAFPIAAGLLILSTQVCGVSLLGESYSLSQGIGSALMIVSMTLIFAGSLK